MANDTAQWAPLAEIIYQYIDQAKLASAEFRRLWTIGVRGVEEVGMDVHMTPKTVKLMVNANKTVDLPSDYFGFSKVGVFNANGEVATLRRNPNLTAYKIDLNDRLTSNTDDTLGDTYRLQDMAYVNYFDGARYVNIFGAGSKLNAAGEFDISEDLGILYLDNDFSYNYVVMEYLSSPLISQKVPRSSTKSFAIIYSPYLEIELLLGMTLLLMLYHLKYLHLHQ